MLGVPPGAGLLEVVDDRAFGNVVVQDGFGGEVYVALGETKAFPLKLDNVGQFNWRQEGETGDGPFRVPQKGMPKERATNFLQVTRVNTGIKWAFYYVEDQPRESLGGFLSSSGPPARPSASTAPQAAGTILQSPANAAADPVVSDLSVKQILEHTTSAAIKFKSFIDEAPERANQLCIAGGLLIMLKSFFGLLAFWDLARSPMVYVVNAYLMFFGFVTVVAEVQPDFAPMAHEKVERIQAWMYEWSLGLKELWGRGLFYIFQGTLALLSCTSLFSLGIVVGPGMMALGIYFLYLYQQCHPRGDDQSLPQDYIRLD